MLKDHNKFTEEVLERVVKLQSEKKTKKERKLAEEELINSLMEVTGLSRPEIKKVMEETRSKHYQKDQRSNEILKKAVMGFTFISIIIGLFFIPYGEIFKESKVTKHVVVSKPKPTKPVEPKVVIKKTPPVKLIESPIMDYFDLSSITFKKEIIEKGNVTSIDVADFNNDGRLDIIANYRERQLVAIYQSNGKKFKRTIANQGWNKVDDILAIDFNNDGYQDFYQTSYETINSRVFLNDGTGKFNTQSISKSEGGKALGKISEGKYDYVLIKEVSQVSVFNQNIYPQYSTERIASSSWDSRDIQFDISDIDNDGDTDVVTLSHYKEFSIGINELLFSDSFSFHLSRIKWNNKVSDSGIKIANMDNENYKDIILFGKHDTNITTFFCDNFNCNNSVQFDTGILGMNQVEISDFNNDFTNELIIGSDQEKKLFILSRDKNGEYTKKIIDSNIKKINEIIIKDINHDGYQDILVATEEGLFRYQVGTK